MSYGTKLRLFGPDREKLNAYSDVVAQLLYNRGIVSNDTAKKFITSDYDEGVYDPFLLKGISIAVDRILQAVSQKQTICIYSDYDADGIPGAAILSDFFRKINFENFFVYIPHRNREGFGLNNNAVDIIAERGTSVIITIDCGISDVESIQYATDKNIDVIVTDHHDPNNHQSRAIAVVNPKQSDCTYPDKNLCGSGVIFKVVQALIKIGTERGIFSIPIGWEKWLLDLVGIATLSDMVPLVGENRVFAKYGLFVMKKSPRKGFCRLLKECDIDQQKITEDDIGFSVAPRINAASRMDDPETAYRMLFTNDDVEADQTVTHLHKINNTRKSTVAVIVKEVKRELGDVVDVPVIVKGNPNWQPSLMGLVASSLVEKYRKPVFLWGRGDGENLKGSCRSNGAVNLVHLMNAVRPGIIGEFGGHEMAGGFVVRDDGVFELPDALIAAYETVKNEKVAHVHIADMELSLDEITPQLFKDVQQLAPFGVANEKPLFLLKGITVASVDYFGKEKNHVKFGFRRKKGDTISAIKFFGAEDSALLAVRPGQTIDVLAHLEQSTFGRFFELRLRIVGIS